MIKIILLDFGGVLAEEGFREGLKEIARQNGLDPEGFYAAADSLIHETGYLTGQAGEADYWNAVRERTGVSGTNGQLREEILKRFVLRAEMIQCVALLKAGGFKVVMLTDQTNWLNEINGKENIFPHFDRILNSFQTHLTKRDASTFTAVCGMLGVKPEETLFVDDNNNHIQRAADRGLETIHFTSFSDFEKRIRAMTGIACKI